MLKFITRIFDRVLFTISFILGVQAPEFIQQYMQRLSGHLNEASFQLQKFQQIADLQFNGDMAQMITRYKTNSDEAIKQTGIIVEDMVIRIEGFEQQLAGLEHGQYITKFYHFLSNIDLEMANATVQHFQLAIPLELGAITTGVIFAFVVLILQSGLKFCALALTNKIFSRAKPLDTPNET